MLNFLWPWVTGKLNVCLFFKKKQIFLSPKVNKIFLLRGGEIKLGSHLIFLFLMEGKNQITTKFSFSYWVFVFLPNADAKYNHIISNNLLIVFSLGRKISNGAWFFFLGEKITGPTSLLHWEKYMVHAICYFFGRRIFFAF